MIDIMLSLSILLLIADRRRMKQRIIPLTTCAILLLNLELIHAFTLPSHGGSVSKRRHQESPINRRRKRSKLDMARSKRINSLIEWAKTSAGIQITESLALQDTAETGIGWHIGSRSVDPGALLLTVPSKTALIVECPGSGPADASVKVDRKSWPWYVQMAVYLHSIQQDTSKMDYTPWLKALPQSFNTPIHWSSLEDLHYEPMVKAVQKQVEKWDALYRSVQAFYPNLPKDEFIYWCEIARSRGFSGSYGGAALNLPVYAFTLLLVAVYLGLNIGTLEQAANGAGVVFSVTVLKGVY